MPVHYNSFLLRCWGLGDQRRVEVEHVQSRERLRVTSLALALAWMKSLAGGPAGDRDALEASADRRGPKLE